MARSTIPTIAIKSDDGFAIINLSDFDEKKHKRANEEPPKAKAKAKAKAK